jgi:hypothetical protein
LFFWKPSTAVRKTTSAMMSSFVVLSAPLKPYCVFLGFCPTLWDAAPDIHAQDNTRLAPTAL